jgi:hypothetical protein
MLTSHFKSCFPIVDSKEKIFSKILSEIASKSLLQKKKFIVALLTGAG